MDEAFLLVLNFAHVLGSFPKSGSIALMNFSVLREGDGNSFENLNTGDLFHTQVALLKEHS